MPLKGLIVIRPHYLFKGQAFQLGQILNLSLWPHDLWSKQGEIYDTVYVAEKSVKNFYTVVNTAKYHFLKIWPNQKGTPPAKVKHVSQTDPS